jgi:hypothetical protein
MMGRREFGVAGLSAAAALAMRSVAVGQQRERRPAEPTGGRPAEGQPRGRRSEDFSPAPGEGRPARDPHSDYSMFDECAQACDECQRECDACSTHCTDLITQGKKEHAATLRTCQDCADVCSATARIVARKGPFSSDICRSCADACAKCGEACEQFSDDEMMKHCAEACRACEEACREMITHLGEGQDNRRAR